MSSCIQDCICLSVLTGLVGTLQPEYLWIFFIQIGFANNNIGGVKIIFFCIYINLYFQVFTNSLNSLKGLG